MNRKPSKKTEFDTKRKKLREEKNQEVRWPEERLFISYGLRKIFKKIAPLLKEREVETAQKN